MLDEPHGLHLVGDEPQSFCHVSDHCVVQHIGSRFARSPLSAARLRDAKLLAFTLDILYQVFIPGERPLLGDGYQSLAAFCGISASRVRLALDVLQESGVILQGVVKLEGPIFHDGVLVPADATYGLDWGVLVPVLQGRAVVLLTLCACVDLIPDPQEWTSVTYGALARHTCYSIGMVQSGLASLIELGAIEQAARAGRGHDYRFSPWALGRAPAPAVVRPARPSVEALPRSLEAPSSLRTTPAVDGSASPMGSGEVIGSVMTVEIGGLIMHLPVGTQITMTISADGTPVYAIGPDLMVRR